MSDDNSGLFLEERLLIHAQNEEMIDTNYTDAGLLMMEASRYIQQENGDELWEATIKYLDQLDANPKHPDLAVRLDDLRVAVGRYNS